MNDIKQYAKQFFSTGSISDYLKFKNIQEKNKHIDAFLYFNKKGRGHEYI